MALDGPSMPARLEPIVGVPVLPGKVISPGFAPPVVANERAVTLPLESSVAPELLVMDEAPENTAS